MYRSRFKKPKSPVRPHDFEFRKEYKFRVLWTTSDGKLSHDEFYASEESADRRIEALTMTGITAVKEPVPENYIQEHPTMKYNPFDKEED